MEVDSIYRNKLFLQGHPDIIQWLACHPSYNEIVYTLGVDGSLSMLNSDSKIVLWKTSVKVRFSEFLFRWLQLRP